MRKHTFLSTSAVAENPLILTFWNLHFTNCCSIEYTRCIKAEANEIGQKYAKRFMLFKNTPCQMQDWQPLPQCTIALICVSPFVWNDKQLAKDVMNSCPIDKHINSCSTWLQFTWRKKYIYLFIVHLMRWRGIFQYMNRVTT